MQISAIKGKFSRLSIHYKIRLFFFIFLTIFIITSGLILKSTNILFPILLFVFVSNILFSFCIFFGFIKKRLWELLAFDLVFFELFFLWGLSFNSAIGGFLSWGLFSYVFFLLIFFCYEPFKLRLAAILSLDLLFSLTLFLFDTNLFLKDKIFIVLLVFFSSINFILFLRIKSQKKIILQKNNDVTSWDSVINEIKDPLPLALFKILVIDETITVEGIGNLDDYDYLKGISLAALREEIQNSFVEQIRQYSKGSHETHYIYRSNLSADFYLNDYRSSVHWFRIIGKKRIDQDSNQINYFCLLIDISVEKTMLDNSRMLMINVEKAKHSKNEFLSNMGHELRTPLNGVIGMTDILLDTTLDQDQKEYTQTIKTSGEKLLSIINDILEYSKLESGKEVVHHNPFYLKGLLENMIQLYSPLAQEKELSVSYELAKEIPDFIWGDKVKIQQILTYLIDNAIKFTSRGFVSLRVYIDNSFTFPHLCFSVVDTGIGITKKSQQEIFDIFSQVDASLTRKYGGIGLGLAIVKNLVALMNGDISVKSKEGAGSDFTFFIPFSPKKNIKENLEPLKIADKKILKKVLLAEDNLVNQKVEKRLLERLKCSVDVVKNGEEAFFYSKKEKYDIIFLDQNMPLKRGYETARIIKNKDNPNCTTPIIMVSGDLQEEEEPSIDDYIVKPLSLDLFSSILKKWCSNSFNKSLSFPVIFNLEYALKMVGGENILRPVLETFLEDTPHQLDSLKNYIEKKQIKEARACCHSIKGAASTVGAENLLEIIIKIQDKLRTNKIDQSQLFLPDLKRAFYLLQEKLLEYLS